MSLFFLFGSLFWALLAFYSWNALGEDNERYPPMTRHALNGLRIATTTYSMGFVVDFQFPETTLTIRFMNLVSCIVAKNIVQAVPTIPRLMLSCLAVSLPVTAVFLELASHGVMVHLDPWNLVYAAVIDYVLTTLIDWIMGKILGDRGEEGIDDV